MKDNPDQHPPHDAKAEEGVVGCLLWSPELITEVEECFGDSLDGFYDLRNREVFDAIRSLKGAGTVVDPTTLQSELKRRGMLDQVGGVTRLAELQDGVPSPANLPAYLEIVRHNWHLRTVIKACAAAVRSSFNGEGTPEHLDGIINQVVTTFRKLEHRSPGRSRIVEPRRASVLMVDDLQRRFDLQGKRSGVATGFDDFDRKTDGLQFGDLTIVAARPSVGKTALALNIAEHAAIRNGIPTIFITLESSVASLTRRMLGMWAKISSGDLRSGMFTQDDFAKFSAFKRILADAPLHFINAVGGASMRQITADVRRIRDRSDVKLIVVDYLQKIKAGERQEKRTYEVGEVSGALKALAEETGAAVLSLAQLNRDSEKGGTEQDGSRRPRLTDLADSKQIEADGDLIVALHRKSRTDENAELILMKGRDCELGICQLNYEGRYYRFSERSQPEKQTHRKDYD